MTAENLTFLIVKSGFENIDLLNQRIYKDAQYEGYHNLLTENSSGIVHSITIFKNLINQEHIKKLLSGYDYLNNSTYNICKIRRIEKYNANEYTGSPIRIRVETELKELYSLPIDALYNLRLE